MEYVISAVIEHGLLVYLTYAFIQSLIVCYIYRSYDTNKYKYYEYIAIMITPMVSAMTFAPIFTVDLLTKLVKRIVKKKNV